MNAFCRSFRSWLAALGLGSLLAAAAGASATPTFWNVEPFPGTGATAVQLWDINDAGTIVGADDFGSFTYRDGVLSRLPAYQGFLVTATGISNSGLISATYFDESSKVHGLLYDGGAYSEVTLAAGQQPLLRHVSHDGRYLAGTYSTDVDSGGFMIDRQTGAEYLLPRPATGGTVILQGVNSLGQVVGSVSGQSPVAVLWTPGTGALQTFSTAGSFQQPRFRGINDAGTVIGFAGAQGIVGTPGGDFRSLGLSGADQTILYGINEAGVVVGHSTFFNDDGTEFTVGLIATPVPEPAAAALLAGGLLLLATRRRAAFKR